MITSASLEGTNSSVSLSKLCLTVEVSPDVLSSGVTASDVPVGVVASGLMSRKSTN